MLKEVASDIYAGTEDVGVLSYPAGNNGVEVFFAPNPDIYYTAVAPPVEYPISVSSPVENNVMLIQNTENPVEGTIYNAVTGGSATPDSTMTQMYFDIPLGVEAAVTNTSVTPTKFKKWYWIIILIIIAGIVYLTTNNKKR